MYPVCRPPHIFGRAWVPLQSRELLMFFVILLYMSKTGLAHEQDYFKTTSDRLDPAYCFGALSGISWHRCILIFESHYFHKSKVVIDFFLFPIIDSDKLNGSSGWQIPLRMISTKMVPRKANSKIKYLLSAGLLSC